MIGSLFAFSPESIDFEVAPLAPSRRSVCLWEPTSLRTILRTIVRVSARLSSYILKNHCSLAGEGTSSPSGSTHSPDSKGTRPPCLSCIGLASSNLGCPISQYPLVGCRTRPKQPMSYHCVPSKLSSRGGY